MPKTYDDDQLERLLRATLRERAGDAPTSLPAKPTRSGRRGMRTAPLLVAAGVALLAVGVPVTKQLLDNGPDTKVAAPATTTTTTTGSTSTTTSDNTPGTAGWRIESYAGVQIRVPATWGWGGAPADSGTGAVLSCGSDHAFVVPGSDTYEFVDPTTPFVGRPAMMTDACDGGWPSVPWPKVDAVWLGSLLDDGVRTQDGQTAETKTVAGQHITVFSPDASLRRQILDTAEPALVDGNGCPATAPDGMSNTSAATTAPTGLSVCVYQGGKLQWSGHHDAAAARAYTTAVDTTSRLLDLKDPRPCVAREAQSPQRVWLGISTGSATPSRWDSVLFSCSLIRSASASRDIAQDIFAGLDPGTIAPWAGGGVKAYVVGDPNLAPPVRTYFRGILG